MAWLLLRLVLLRGVISESLLRGRRKPIPASLRYRALFFRDHLIRRNHGLVATALVLLRGVISESLLRGRRKPIPASLRYRALYFRDPLGR